MKIEMLGRVDDLLMEKQLQPAQGQKYGNILLMAGSPGSGKNWTINTLTDVNNRYKIFDIDSVKELSAKFVPERLTSMFEKWLEKLESKHEYEDAIAVIHTQGLDVALKDEDLGNLFHRFLVDEGIFNNHINSVLKSIFLSNNPPNIAFNSTFRTTADPLKSIEVMRELGYDVDGKVDIIYVIAPLDQVKRNISKRGKEVRATSMEYVMDAMESVDKNIFDILKGTSPLTPYIRNVYVVVNDKDAMQYYDDTDVVKNFKYVTLKPNDSNSVRKMAKLRY